ncbi:MAG: flagellin [Zetaproteobacteria bacterium]|nr:flagellin [Zetaproteobacteria bacterium]
MTLRIRSNIASLRAQRHFGTSNRHLKAHMEKLASGQRINKAADDAAGLAIAEVLRADVRSLSQARRNANDSISLIQVAEGGLNEITGIVVRLRELAVQSASDTIGPRERQHIHQEFKQLKDEIDRITFSTEYNGTRLLTGTGTELPQDLKKEHQPPPLEFQVDKDYFVLHDGLQVRSPLNIIRANLQKINSLTYGNGSLDIGRADNPLGTRVDQKQHAQMSIDKLDHAVQKIASYRARLGALQNRLSATDRNLSIRIESLATARSRILDADFAHETAEVTQWKILAEGGASVLTQANQLPQMALSLLKN